MSGQRSVSGQGECEWRRELRVDTGEEEKCERRKDASGKRSASGEDKRATHLAFSQHNTMSGDGLGQHLYCFFGSILVLHLLCLCV